MLEDLRLLLRQTDMFNEVELPTKIIVVDFELAILGAVSDTFPEWTVYGCQFHFKQALQEQAKKKGLVPLENSNGEFREWLVMVACLVYVPPKKTFQYFMVLVGYAKQRTGLTAEIIMELSQAQKDDVVEKKAEGGQSLEGGQWLQVRG